MIDNYPHTVTTRFLCYVQIDTQADPNSETQPSSEKQKDLSRLLVSELKAIGIDDAELDPYGYVYATIPATIERPVPVICLCAHVDTSPDCSGMDVKPILHKNWDGGAITLPDDPAIVIRPEDHPYLATKKGEDIITASGLTLLGADDKAGVAILMDLAAYLMQNPQIPHGKIRLLFTPDEEIGRGVDKVDMAKLGADFGYTLDGGENFSIEGESFSADGMKIVFHGVSIHPGTAKGKLVSAIKAAADFIARLPTNSLSPETTELREGFVHPVQIEGGVEKTTLTLILRDFDTPRLARYAQKLRDLADQTKAAFPGLEIDCTTHQQYRNMREILDHHPLVMEHAEAAYRRAGLGPQRLFIRGGTDGSRLSFMGLPCPNLFTGEMALHGKQEYVSIQDMEKSVAMLVELVQIWAE